MSGGRLQEAAKPPCQLAAAAATSGGSPGPSASCVPAAPQLPFCCPWHPADLPGSSPKWQEINPEREGIVLRLGELNQLGGAGQWARKGEQGLPLLTAASGQLGRPGSHPSFGAPSTHPLASYHCQNVVEQHPDKPAELF